MTLTSNEMYQIFLARFPKPKRERIRRKVKAAQANLAKNICYQNRTCDGCPLYWQTRGELQVVECPLAIISRMGCEV